MTPVEPDLLHQFSNWTLGAGVLSVICMAQMACLAAVYSHVLSTFIRKKLKRQVFLVRVTGFVLMHAFVFGALVTLAATLASFLYRLIPHPWPPFVMLGVFLLIGIVAEEYKKI